MKKNALFAFSALFLMISQAFAETPSVPSGITLTSSSQSITVKWTANNDTITDGYYIYHWKTGSSSEPNRQTILHTDTATNYTHTITGLTNNTEYTVKVTAYDGTDESNSTTRTISTTSIEIDVELTDVGTIQIALAQSDSSVETYDLYVGTSHVVPDPVTGIPDVNDYDVLDVIGLTGDAVYTLTGLSNMTYYIFVKVHYSASNTGYSQELAFVVDDFGTFFSSAGDIDNGCFIGSASGANPGIVPIHALMLIALAVMIVYGKRFRILMATLVVIGLFGSTGFAADDRLLHKNLVGVKGGLFMPSEDLQHDVYDSVVPVSLFYERMLNRFFSADVSAGYCRAKGYAVTASAEETGVRTDLDLIPLAMSLNVNMPLHELITVYMGAGGDYWFFDERSLNGDYTHEVGGWHGKVGFKLFTGDVDYFKQGGVLIEASYAAIDRFGKNDVDLGGWTYSLGVMYCF